jgi:Cu2+-exporting ATPase
MGPKGKNHDHGQDGGHQSHHAQMVADFRRRFWVSVVLSVPILALTPMIQGVLGVEKALAFRRDGYVQFVLSAAVFFYSGWFFLKGLFEELGRKNRG